MRSTFPLFQSHLDLAHAYWSKILQSGDHAIDATCGNGHDTLKLCQLALSNTQGKIYALDRQKEAIANTKKNLAIYLNAEKLEKVDFILTCHSQFPTTILPDSIKLIVYNLGYLPGGNKKETTLSETTILSLQNALNLVQAGGVISLTCYPGHDEGLQEEQKLLQFVQSLSPLKWSCCHHQWLNRKNAPSLLLLQKAQNHPKPTTVL
jgi:hypothetical protein